MGIFVERQTQQQRRRQDRQHSQPGIGEGLHAFRFT
jgi:hypothetical protein